MDTAEIALAAGWKLHAVCPYPDMPGGFHAKLMGDGNEVVDLAFTDGGTPVQRGQYALWIRKKTQAPPRPPDCEVCHGPCIGADA